MINEFLTLSSPPEIWLCYPVPVFESRWGISDSVVVNGIIPVVDKISADLGLPVIDLYHPLLDEGDLFPDAIHPDRKGAEIMARIISGKIKDSAE